MKVDNTFIQVEILGLVKYFLKFWFVSFLDSRLSLKIVFLFSGHYN